jgi:DNA-binding transcriptional LysR family regulator
MRKTTPSLNSIRAFESAARHESFAKAAKELAVSASAISQQVSQLEADLGVMLFARVRQRLKLTDAGRSYQQSLSAALDRIESATTDLISNKGTQRLRVGSLPSLATYWLIPRLPSFIQQHSSINLHIVTLELDFASPERSPDLKGGWIDVGLFFGDGHWPGLKSEKLMNEQLVPVISPCQLKRTGLTAADADHVIDQSPLLQHSTRPQSWEEWFQSRGRESKQSNGPGFEHFHMLVDAAKAGIGVALVPLAFVEADLESNRLVRLGHELLEANRAYYLVSTHGHELCESHRAFSAWLRDQVRQGG